MENPWYPLCVTKSGCGLRPRQCGRQARGCPCGQRRIRRTGGVPVDCRTMVKSRASQVECRRSQNDVHANVNGHEDEDGEAMDFRFWLVLLMRGLPTSHEMWTRALQKRRGMNGILTLHSECGPLPLQDVGYIGHLQDVGYIGHRSGIVFRCPSGSPPLTRWWTQRTPFGEFPYRTWSR